MTMWTTAVWQWARTLGNSLLSSLTARPAAALLVTPKVRLFKGATVPGPDSLLSDFTATAFTGYADAALTLTGPVNLNLGVQGMVGTVDFVMAGTVTAVPDTADGYVLTDGTAAYYGGEKFEATVNFGQYGDFLQVNVQLPETLTQDLP